MDIKRECIRCGGYVSYSNTSNRLCYDCEKALGRSSSYVPVEFSLGALPSLVLFVYSLALGLGEIEPIGLFENNWIEAGVVFILGAFAIGYVDNKSDSGSKLFKFVLIAINLIIVYLLLKWFGAFK